MLTQKYLKSILNYNPETGLFTWLVSRGSIKVGSLAICKHQGYIVIKIDGKTYQAHRLAFLYMTGEFPSDICDHINMVRDDNRFLNLRNATRSQNAINSKISKTNTSGFRGVSWDKYAKKYMARIGLNGRLKYLGVFKDKQKAADAYDVAALKHFGEFANINGSVS